MPTVTKWIVGYGLLLLACNAIDSWELSQLELRGRTLIGGCAGGLLVIAAGLAAGAGRRSLRLGGLYVGIFLPLAIAGVFAWRAADSWRGQALGHAEAIFMSLLTLATVALVWIVIQLRPREGIASRGYAVAISGPRIGLPDVQTQKQPGPSDLV